MNQSTETNLFGTEKIWKILLRLAPPVMFAQLIQALYNIVDSYFVGKYSPDGLTALSVIFPVQLIITALAVGTGVGVNTQMARLYAQKKEKEANETAGTGMVLSLFTWILFAILSALLMSSYVATSAKSETAIQYGIIYGKIVCIGSIGIFLESIWTKVLQAEGNMRLPMIAQIAGAITNILLDPVLIFGMFGIPELGIAGAAIATVCGQIVAAIITGTRGFRMPPAFQGSAHQSHPRGAFHVTGNSCHMKNCIKWIYRLGYPSILMQMLYTVYIVALNIILAGFSDAAVTVLGLYYKMQTFFFIPLLGLQTCIVPVLSYNHASKQYKRCRLIMKDSVLFSLTFMLVGVFCFEALPETLLCLFSNEADVLSIGVPAFRIIGSSFLPAVISLLSPVFFQAIGNAKASALLSLIRQLGCLIPVFWALSKLGLVYTWIAFPVAELITGAIGIILYLRQIRQWSAA